MQKSATRTFKRALKSLRKEKGISLQELGLRIESDASHIYKLENGHDVTLSTMLRVAEALGEPIRFGKFVLAHDSSMKIRKPRKAN